MIRHCVLIRLDPAAGRAELVAIYAGLAALTGKLPGMQRFAASRNVSPEGLGQGFDDGFEVDFADAAARDAYLVDPDHQALGRRLGAVARGGTDGILVFDFDRG